MSPDTSSSFGFLAFLQHIQENPIALAILAILAFMSILSWYLILTKTIHFLWINWQSKRFQHFFWQAEDLNVVINYLREKGAHNPFARLTQQGINAALSHEHALANHLEKLVHLCTQSEFITRHLRHSIDAEREKMNAGLSILASIGSTAPFIGLLGTVLGIYSALVNISNQGSASLDTVAGPVGEALIMTAIGLGVAIPAVMFYNALVKNSRSFLHRLDTFANDLHAYLNIGIRADKHNLHTLPLTKTINPTENPN